MKTEKEMNKTDVIQKKTDRESTRFSNRIFK